MTHMSTWISAGFVDPAKVVRVALQDAASIAGLLITTEAMIVEGRAKKRPVACLPAAAWAAWVEWTTDPLPAQNPKAYCSG